MGYVPLTPAPRETVALWAAISVPALAAGALAFGLLGAGIGVSVGSATTGIAWRGALTLLFVVLGTRIVVERATVHGVPSPAPASLAVAAVAFAVDPLTWDARTALTQLAVAPGAATVVGDLALWLVAAYLGVVWGTRNGESLTARKASGPRW